MLEAEARYLGPERTNFQIPADVIASNWSDYKHATWDACWERATVPSKGYGVLFTKEVFIRNIRLPQLLSW